MTVLNEVLVVLETGKWHRDRERLKALMAATSVAGVLPVREQPLTTALGHIHKLLLSLRLFSHAHWFSEVRSLPVF
jgi:hypothetical protein